MKKVYLLAFLVFATVFCMTACSGSITESENPEIVANFADAKAFIVRSADGDASASASKSLGKTAGASDYADYPILKLTSNDGVLPAITGVTGMVTDIPDVMAIRLLNNKYYVLFDQNVTAQSEICRLVEVSSDNSIRCIDSETIPCTYGPSIEYDIPNEDANRRGFVSLRPNGDIAYLTSDLYANLYLMVAVLKTDGTRAMWNNGGIYYSWFVESSDNTLYGLDCVSDFDVNMNYGHHSPYCLLNEDSVVDLGGELSVDLDDPPTEQSLQASVWPLSGDRLVVDYRSASLLEDAGTPLRFASGSLGDEITSANFSSYVTADPSLFTRLDNISLFEIDDGSIYGTTYGRLVDGLKEDESLNLVRADGLQRYSATANNFDLCEDDFSSQVDYADGGQIAISCSDSGTAKIFLFDPNTEEVTSVVDDLVPYSMRFIDENTLVFTTPGTQSGSYDLYKYTVDTGTLTLLFTEEDPQQRVHMIFVP